MLGGAKLEVEFERPADKRNLEESAEADVLQLEDADGNGSRFVFTLPIVASVGNAPNWVRASRVETKGVSATHG